MSDQSDMNPNGLIPELTDEDVYDAMRRLPGYLDITTDDFRALYHLAFEHALERLVGSLRARDLMRPADAVLSPKLALGRAAEIMSAHQLKSSPVTDEQGLVVGILSETDVLRWMGARTFLELIARPPDQQPDRDRLLHSTSVNEVMTSPAVTLSEDADFAAIMRGFKSHGGRRMPVVDANERLLGVLVRKDFLTACSLSFDD